MTRERKAREIVASRAVWICGILAALLALQPVVTSDIVAHFVMLLPQKAFALESTISSQASCEAIGGSWVVQSGLFPTCTISNLTINSGDSLRIVPIPLEGGIRSVRLIVSSGVLDIRSGAFLTIEGGVVSLQSGSTINNAGTIGISHNSGLDGILALDAGTLNNFGAINNAGRLQVSSTSAIKNSGTVINGLNIFNHGSFINGCTGSLVNNGSYSGNPPVHICDITTTTISGTSLSVPFGSSTLSVTVADTIDAANVPVGTVSWATTAGSLSSGSCTLTDGHCSVFYTPPTPAVPVTVTATYNGGFMHQSSSGSFTMPIFIELANQSSCQSFAGLWDSGTNTCNVTNLTINSGGTLQVASGTTLAATGAIRVNPEGALSSSGNINIGPFGMLTNTGTFFNSVGGTIVSPRIENENGGTFTNSGTIDNNGGDIVNFGTFNNSGDMKSQPGNIDNQAGGTLNNDGTIDVDFGGNLRNSGEINNDGVIRNGANLFNFGGTIDNPGEIINMGFFSNGAAAFINNSGTIQNDGTFNNGGTINSQCGGVITGNPVSGNAPVDGCNEPVSQDAAFSTDEETPVSITLTATDADGDALIFSVVSPPSNGTLSGTAPDLSYTPNANFFGTDSFTFKANDGIVDSNVATITITVNPVNDAPIADSQSVTTDEDQPVDITLTGSDLEGSPLVFSIVSDPSHGTLSGSGATRTYTPAANYYGADSFVFRVNDGQHDSGVASISITILPIQDPPEAVDDAASTNEDTPLNINVVSNDIEIDGDTLTITSVTQGTIGSVTINPDNTVRYEPGANLHGLDSFSYTVSDGNGGSDTATVAVEVNSVLDPIIAHDKSIGVDEDTTVVFTLDITDVEGATLLTFFMTKAPSHGTVASDAPGIVTYTPHPDYSGPDSLQFDARDLQRTSNTATISITVNPVSDAPVLGQIDDMHVDELGTLAFEAAATDVDSTDLTFSLSGEPEGASITAGGMFSFSPTEGQGPGTYSFDVVVSDGELTDSQTVTITVNEVNVDPTADAGSDQEVKAESVVELSGKGEDTDIPAQELTFSWIQTGGPAAVTLDGSDKENPTFVPVEPGTYEFELTVADSFGGADSDAVAITVIPLTPSEKVDKLQQAVSEMDLPEEIEDGLSDKLEAAADSIESGLDRPAQNQLRAFINQVEAQTGKSITEEQAEMLIEAARNIINSIS